MTVPNIFVGGTKAKASEVNENFNAVTIHRKVFTDATERTTSSGPFVDTATTFAFLAPVNSLIIGISLKCEIRHDDGAGQVGMSLKINGSNLGTKHFSSGANRSTGAVEDTEEPFILSTETSLCVFKGAGGSFKEVVANTSKSLKVLDASTTLTIRLQSQAGGQVRIKNVEIEVIYVDSFTED